MAAAARTAGRYITRRLSSGGKILSEEEKAAENIYIKYAKKVTPLYSEHVIKELKFSSCGADMPRSVQSLMHSALSSEELAEQNENGGDN